jgi:protein SCO1
MIINKVEHGGVGVTKNSLEMLGKCPDFSFTDQDGKPFTAENLKAKVNVINFMFTTCQGICPTLSIEMKKLQQMFLRQESFSLLSISVDPENDTPVQLKAWAEKNNIDTQHWSMVTSERKNIKDLLEKGLKVGLPDQPQAHSDRFVLLDRENNIRGYYRLGSPETLEKLRVDIFSLL